MKDNEHNTEPSDIPPIEPEPFADEGTNEDYWDFRGGSKALRELLGRPAPTPLGNYDKAKMKACALKNTAESRREYATHENARHVTHTGGELALCQGYQIRLAACVAVGLRDVQRMQSWLNSRDSFIRSAIGASKLSVFELLNVILICGIGGVIAIQPAISIPKLLLENFTSSPVVAVSMSFLCLGGALIIEIIGRHIKMEETKDRFTIGVAVAAALTLTVWIMLASSAYGPLIFAQDISDPPHWAGKAQLAAAMLTEALVVGGVILTIGSIYEKKRPKAEHQEYNAQEKRLNLKTRKNNILERFLIMINARIEAHKKASEVHVGGALAEYDRFIDRIGD